MVTDLLLSWPRNCDYPKWRQFLRDNRQRFNEVLIAFTETNQGYDYRDFIKAAMFPDYVHIINAPEPGPNDDWRNLAVNALLLHSYNAPWLWFTEQDFYPLEGFWEEVQKHEDEGCDVVAVYDSGRMHPCCIFVNRNVINRTRKNFGIVPNKYDHFFLFQEDLEGNDLKIGTIKSDVYFHHNGLSHNMTLLASGKQPNYEPKAFAKWLNDSLKASVPLDQRFIDLASKMR